MLSPAGRQRWRTSAVSFPATSAVRRRRQALRVRAALPRRQSPSARCCAEVGEGRRDPVIVLMLPGAILPARRRAENVNSKG